MTLTTRQVHQVLLNPEVYNRTVSYVYGRFNPVTLGRHLDDVVGRVLLGFTEYTMDKGLDPNLLTNLYPYLNTHTREHLRNELRNTNRVNQTEDETVRTSPTSDYTRQSTRDPLSTLISDEIYDDILGLLSDRERNIVLLLVDGYSKTDISRMEGVSNPMVTKIINRIRTKLNHLIK